MGAQAIYHKLFEFDYPNKPFLMSGEYESLTKQNERLEEALENIVSKMDILEDSIKEVKGAVIGNPPMGMKGLAERMEDIEDRMKEYDHKGVMASTERVSTIEEKLRGYDKILDRATGAAWAGKLVWVIIGLGGGWITKTLLAKAGIIIP